MVELFRIVVRAEDPDRPAGRLPLRIVSSMRSEFAAGEPWIDEKLARIQKICRSAGNDFSVDMINALLVTPDQKKMEPEGVPVGAINRYHDAHSSNPHVAQLLRPMVQRVRPRITLWCLAWTAVMDDNGGIVIDCEDCFSRPGSRIAAEHFFEKSVYAKDSDGVTLENVMARMGRVNAIMDRVVERFVTPP
jgi:hypothetical protein